MLVSGSRRSGLGSDRSVFTAPLRRAPEAMTRFLATAMAARGVDCVFLMADTERIAQISARAGFRTVSEVLAIAFTSV